MKAMVFSMKDSIFKRDPKEVVVSTTKRKEHDQTFNEYIRNLSKRKPNNSGGWGVKTQELACRVGIEYEMFRKILNQTKPNQPRDCIIAICAALFLSTSETNKALFYYDDLPKLDDSTGCRDFFIIETLEANFDRETDLMEGVNDINKKLSNYQFSELRLSNRIKTKEAQIIPIKSRYDTDYKVKTEISSSQYFYQNSLCEFYNPMKYSARSYMKIFEENKEVTTLVCQSNDDRLYRYKSPVDRDVLEEDSELYDLFSSHIKDSNLRELRKCYEVVFDSRNHGMRKSAKYIDGSIVLFAESYNYIQPERNEYVYAELSKGVFTFTILKKSQFMCRYLDKMEFEKYYPQKQYMAERNRISFTSLESLRDFCKNKNYNSPDTELAYCSYFSKLKKVLEELANNLKERKEYIRRFDECFDNEPWRIYEFYNVIEEFECKKMEEKWEVYKEENPFDAKYGEDDGKEIGDFLGYDIFTWIKAQKDEAEFEYNNQKVRLRAEDLKFAFELGIDDVEEICKFKLKYLDSLKIYEEL